MFPMWELMWTHVNFIVENALFYYVIYYKIFAQAQPWLPMNQPWPIWVQLPSM